MSWTKEELVRAAYEELSLQGYNFDLDQEELELGMRRMDSMLATWNGKGIRLGYPIPSTSDGGNLDDSSTLPDSANETVYLNLAIRLAAGFGKQVTQATMAAAKEGYDVLLSRAAMPIEQQLPNTLGRGAGNKTWRGNTNPFFNTPVDPVAAGGDGPINFE